MADYNTANYDPRILGLLQAGLGILANNGRGMSGGQAIGQGLLGGLDAFQAAQKYQNDAAWQKKERDRKQAEWDNQDAIKKIFGDASVPERPNPQWSFKDAATISDGNQVPYNVAQNLPAGIDYKSAVPKLMGVDPMVGMKVDEWLKSQNKPVAVAAGTSMYAPNDFSKPLFTAPLAPKYSIAPSGAVVDLNNPDMTKNYGKVESGKTRQIQVGTTKVTQELQPDGTWKEIGRGPQFARQVPSVVIDGSAVNELSPQAVENAAARYNIDGTLPPLGMGGGSLRKQILNRAGELSAASGVGGDEQRISQLNVKALGSGLNQVQKQRAMVGAFERNFIKNVDLALEYSGKVDRTGVPIINSWINAGKRAVTGNKELSAFDVAVKSAVNEYTKILSGSMGNTQMAEAEVKKVENLLSAAQTPEQVLEVVNFMKRETGNRMAGFDEEIAAIHEKMGKGTPNGKKSAISSGGWSATLRK